MKSLQGSVQQIDKQISLEAMAWNGQHISNARKYYWNGICISEPFNCVTEEAIIFKANYSPKSFVNRTDIASIIDLG